MADERVRRILLTKQNSPCSGFEGAPQPSFCFARRAGPALPSCLALHHAGFSLPRLLPDERWALTPPFHPYQQKAPLHDDEQVSLPPVTAASFPGGLFSVALSVNGSTGFNRCSSSLAAIFQFVAVKRHR